MILFIVKDVLFYLQVLQVSTGVIDNILVRVHVCMGRYVRPFSGTRRLFETQHLLALQLNLPPASKQGRHLFKEASIQGNTVLICL